MPNSSQSTERKILGLLEVSSSSVPVKLVMPFTRYQGPAPSGVPPTQEPFVPVWPRKWQ